MIYAGRPTSIKWFIGMFGFLLWAALPYCLIAIANKLFKNNKKINITLFITTIIISLLSIAALVDAFFIHIDPQAGLVFIFLPMPQLVIASLGILIAIILSKLNKKTQITKQSACPLFSRCAIVAGDLESVLHM